MILVLRHPDVVACEQSPVVLNAVWSSKQLLRCRSVNLVSNGLTTDWILLVEVLDFERPAVDGIVIETLGRSDGRLADLVPISLGIRLRINLHSMTLFIDDRIVMAVNRRVDS